MLAVPWNPNPLGKSFIVGSVLSVRAVTYYSVPADLSMRLTALPSSIVVPLFPAFSALDAENNHARVGVLYARSIKYVALSIDDLRYPLFRLIELLEDHRRIG